MLIKKLLKLNEKKGRIFLFLLVTAFAFGYVLVSVLRHLRFESLAYDLGIYDQAIWLFSRFQVPFSTIKNTHLFGDHLIPVLAILGPLYWLTDDALALLVFQVIWVVAGAIPVYMLAKERLKSVFLSLVLAFAYLSFFGIQNGVIFDFHPLLLAVPLIAWWFYFFEKNNKVYLLISLLLLGFQENLGLLVLALGVMAALKRETRKEGLIIVSVGFIWFLLATKIFIPHFAQNESFSYFPKAVSLKPQIFLQEFFYPFEKIKTILISLGAIGFLPVFYPPILIPLAEQFAERFVGNMAATRWGIGLHYSAPLAPILLYGTIKVLEKKFFQKKGTFLLSIGIFLLMLSLFYQFFLHLPLNLLSKKEFYRLPEWHQDLGKVSLLIGENDSLATQNNLLPHFSHREKIYLFSSCAEVPNPSRGMFCQPLVDQDSQELPLIEKEKTKFILVNFHPRQNPNNFFPDGEESLKKYGDKLLLDKKYKIRFKEGEIILLERI